MPLGRQNGPNTAYVVHLRDAALLSRELADRRVETLETLCNLDAAFNLTPAAANVITEVRRDRRERPGVQATPPRQRLPRTVKLVFVGVRNRAFCSVALCAFANVQQQLPSTIDLPLREPG